MTEYRAIYKCRMCGEEFEKDKADYKRAVAAVLCLGMFGNESFDDPTTDISIYRVKIIHAKMVQWVWQIFWVSVKWGNDYADKRIRKMFYFDRW